MEAIGNRKPMTYRFLAWVNELHEHGEYRRFIGESGLFGDTLTRWRKGVQEPTFGSLEKVVLKYAAFISKSEGLEGERANARSEEIERDVFLRVIGADGMVKELREVIKKRDATIKLMKAKNKK